MSPVCLINVPEMSQETFNTYCFTFLVSVKIVNILNKKFLNNYDRCLEYTSVSYTMVYKPCYEELYVCLCLHKEPIKLFLSNEFLKGRTLL